MIIFESEKDLPLTIERYNQIIRACVSEEITFQEFLSRYNSFYAFYALDGHESDLQEQTLLEKHQDKIAPHWEVFEKLSGLCSDEDALKESYIQANSFGSDEGLRRLKEISKKYSI